MNFSSSTPSSSQKIIDLHEATQNRQQQHAHIYLNQQHHHQHEHNQHLNDLFSQHKTTTTSTTTIASLLANNSILSSISTTTSSSIINSPGQFPCYMVNNLITTHDQCKFVLDNNCLEKEAAFDYVHLVYCELGYDFRNISISLLAFLVIVLFLALSSIADEFLCPSLLSVAKNLRMSDNLAGVTLLAFGNGCTDIFASIAAASSDRSELIVGELLGAGIFCTSIVSGLILIHSDFKLPTRPILRDTTFYLFAVYLVWCFCDARQVTFYGALSFILIYIVYLILALSGQAIHSKFMGNYQINNTPAASDDKSIMNIPNDNDNEIKKQLTFKKDSKDWHQWKEESMRRKSGQNEQKKIEIENLMSNQKMMRVEQCDNGVTMIHMGSDSLLPPSTGDQIPLSYIVATTLEMSLSSTLNRKLEDSVYENKAFEQNEDKPSKSIESKETKKYNEVDRRLSDQVSKVKKFNHSDLNQFDDLLAHISPIDKSLWKDKNFFSKLINIIRAPLLFAAILTIPVVDYDKKRNNWCRLLNAIHCITVPMTLTFVIGKKFNLLTLFNVIPIPLLILPLAVILFFFVLRSTTLQQAPNYHPIFAYFGFLMSVLWIYTLATEIIGLLKTVGIIFSMTDTAIGLGILAWGNSLGDIVANISLAEAGYPRMALGASIGAPLLNLLLGFGLSFTISLKPGEVSEIEYSPTITLLCSTLAIIIIAIMCSTLIPAHKSRKPFGYLLIFCYGVYFVLAVCFEYNVIKF